MTPEQVGILKDARMAIGDACEDLKTLGFDFLSDMKGYHYGWAQEYAVKAVAGIDALLEIAANEQRDETG